MSSMTQRHFVFAPHQIAVGIAALLIVPLAVATPSVAVAAPGDIVAENALQGTPAAVWDVNGSGSASIQGFATDISVNVGGTVEFKIDTVSADYRIDIYRLGWYDGDGARQVATIGTEATTETDQPECTVSASPENLVDCGNWTPSASWAVPTDAVSGIYIARPTRQDVGGDLASHIVFIVRDDDSTSEVLFQTADTTWQAYNKYGGYSLYAGGHAHAVSYNRPFATRDGAEAHDWLFNSEYPMLRWLERNGYDVSYTTGVDSDRRGQLIKNHNVFLSVGHDEYWSKGQRDFVEAARDNTADPTNLAFFSGNEVYWKTRWDNEHRTLISYKEGNAAGSAEHYDCYNVSDCDPDSEWTGLWRQAPSSTPENALTGQISWHDSTETMKVPADYAPLRFWRDTAVASLTPGTTADLGAGTLGYEWNQEQAAYADHYPSNRIKLSETTAGGDTHHLSLHRADSGALVFGAGTVQWPWGLDSNPSSPGASENLIQQQATANILADMGALPTSLQTQLTMPTASTDTTAPEVSIVSPADGADVPGGGVTVSGTATDDGAVATVEVSLDDGTTWSPATGTSTWEYTFTKADAGNVTVQVRATDDSVNTSAAISRTFGTAAQVCDQTNPCSIFGATVTGTEDNDNTAAELGLRFRSDTNGFITGIRFFKTTGNTGTHVGNLWTNAGTNLGTVTFTGESATGWQQATFDNPIAITAETTYVASYYAPVGRYAVGQSLVTGVSSPPLQALADGVDGDNGLYEYGTGGFPEATFESSNYLVDVLFAETAEVGPDVTPPSVVSRTPVVGATAVSVGTNVTAVFNEPLDEATVTTSTVALRDAASAIIPATVTWNAATRTVTLDPNGSLAAGTVYTVTVTGGAEGVKDVVGNALAADVTWNFTTATPPVDRPDPNTGPGGPVLVVAGTGSHGTYLAEILRAEGLNLFDVGSRADLTAAGLAAHETLVLAETALTAAQVTAITDWVDAGGNLVAMRPDAALADLFGLSPAAGEPLSEGYIEVDTATSPGAGIVGTTMQFHGTADRYTADAGTQVVATLFSDAATTTSNPAVTVRTVGTAGGSAAAFTFDLARSVVLTRQGNPAWINQNRDNEAGPNRGNDLFFGGADDSDWVDLSKVAIPQADEQQRLLANVITEITMDAVPLPRLWYLPRGEKAAIVMTADNHNGGSVDGRFDQEIAASTPDCSVEDWECIRSTAYIYPANSHMTDAEARAYQDMGFVISLHPNTGCTSPSQATFAGQLVDQWADLQDTYPSLNPLRTNRNHCIAWIDWADVPEELVTTGVHLDTNYYYWPPTWVNDTPGVFTGSGFAQRFADSDGQLIDVYQATTQMTDESGQTYPFTASTLMDRALGAEGYYGTFVANIHSDGSSESQNAAVIAAAQDRNVPVISAEQLLDWTDGRNASSFQDVSFTNDVLTFSVDAADGSNGLQAMIPVTGTLEQLTLDGNPVATTEQTIKGVRYAFFTPTTGAYAATFGEAAEDTTPPVISDVVATANADGTATITWTTDEPSSSLVDYGTDEGILSESAEDAAPVTTHQLMLEGLTPGTAYYYRVTSTDAASNSATSPEAPAAPGSFDTPTTPTSGATDDTVADFSLGTLEGMAVTDTSGGEVVLGSEVGADFSGTALPEGWSSTIWNAGGATTLANGSAAVDGSLLAYGPADQMYGPGRSIESTATFGAAANQHIGFGEDMNLVNRWAIFSTNQSTSTLQARTNTPGGPVYNVDIPGSWIGAEHTYRIDWQPSQVIFSIDGDVVHTQPVTIVGSMRPLASDYNTGGPALAVNSMFLSPPYVASGTFESRIHDAGSPADWGTLDYEADIPADTTLGLEVRAGNTATLDGTWTDFTSVADGAEMALTGQYLQYRVTAATTNPDVTPTLLSVNLPNAPAATGAATTTTLQAGTPTHNSVELTATVVPSDAIGVVQFQKDGAAIGSPVAVDAGSASLAVSDLTPSTDYSFTAIFVPTDTAAHAGSTSAAATVTTAEAPPIQVTEVTAPTFTDDEGSNGGTVFIPTVNGVEFLIDDVVTAPGTYPQTAGAVTVTAQALPGYVIADGVTVSWTHTFVDTTPTSGATDDTVSDFSAGTLAGMAVTNASGGEVVLASKVGTDFSGTALPEGWSSTPWNEGGVGTVTVADGSAEVDGSLLAYGPTDPMYGPGRSIESTATFGAVSFQHVGFGEDMNNVARWAVFSTHNANGTGLYARTNAAGTVADVLIQGDWVGSEHTYRIDWQPSQVIFSIDGDVVHTQPVTIVGTMRPLASDFATGGPALAVNSMFLTLPYVDSGTFESRIHDAGSPADWGTLDYEADIPADTTLALDVRAGNTATPDGTWTDYTPVADGAEMALTGQYLQYRATATTTNPDVTPTLFSVDLPNTPASLAVETTTTLAAGTPTDNSVELTATVAPSDAGGEIQFQQDGENIGTPVTVVDGSASLTASDLTPSTDYSFTAIFVPTDTAAHTGSTSAAATVTTAEAPLIQVTEVTAPTFTDDEGSNGGTVFIPTVNGVEFLIDDVVTAPGTYPQTAGEVTVTAQALSGFVITEGVTVSWTHTFVDTTRVPTTTTIAAAAPTHDSVELTATIEPTAAGSVQFRQNGNNIGDPVPVAAGLASYTAIELVPETEYSFTAVFIPADATAYTGSTSTAVVVTTTPATPACEVWSVEYYATNDLTGDPVWTDCVTEVNQDWGYSSPAPGIVPVDNFSARYTTTLNEGAGAYDFTAKANHRIRVRVGDQLIIDRWDGNNSNTTNTAQALLGTGPQEVVVEYRELTGAANIHTTVTKQAACTAWSVEYYATNDLTGDPVWTDCVTEVNQDWGYSSPAPGIVPVDNFSARYTTTLNEGAGAYDFTAKANHRIRVRVGDQLIIDRWDGNNSNTTNTAQALLGTGPHEVVVEYRELTGAANIHTTITKQAACTAWSVEYYATNDLTGDPVWTDCVTEVNQDWGYSSPAPGNVPVDNFSARYTTTLNEGAGAYDFTAKANHRIRVRVGDQLIIDRWDGNNSNTTNTAQALLGTGPHEVVVEYRELTGGRKHPHNHNQTSSMHCMVGGVLRHQRPDRRPRLDRLRHRGQPGLGISSPPPATSLSTTSRPDTPPP